MDPRIGRRWNTDPVTVAWESPYAVNRNNPILFTDPDGDIPKWLHNIFKPNRYNLAKSNLKSGSRWQGLGNMFRKTSFVAAPVWTAIPSLGIGSIGLGGIAGLGSAVLSGMQGSGGMQSYSGKGNCCPDPTKINYAVQDQTRTPSYIPTNNPLNNKNPRRLGIGDAINATDEIWKVHPYLRKANTIVEVFNLLQGLKEGDYEKIITNGAGLIAPIHTTGFNAFVDFVNADYMQGAIARGYYQEYLQSKNLFLKYGNPANLKKAEKAENKLIRHYNQYMK
ncbi:MAG: hypothetical protein H0X62_17640 [Bacteroidetes bacterium]|nr:hypothetical protein [Bacteroidota bacterium]